MSGRAHIIDAVVTHTIAALAFTVWVAIVTIPEIKKRLIERPNTDKWHDISNNLVVRHRFDASDKFLPVMTKPERWHTIFREIYDR